MQKQINPENSELCICLMLALCEGVHRNPLGTSLETNCTEDVRLMSRVVACKDDCGHPRNALPVSLVPCSFWLGVGNSMSQGFPHSQIPLRFLKDVKTWNPGLTRSFAIDFQGSGISPVALMENTTVLIYQLMHLL